MTSKTDGSTRLLPGSPRVLDLAQEGCALCGRILADLGADVIKVEPPDGDPARETGPFYHDTPRGENSLFWLAMNAGKRGITLNLDTADGRMIFKRLAKAADFVIESFRPGHMSERGLGYEVLSELNPRIVMTSVSPFGQRGPRKDYKAPDIVASAMSGWLYLCGDADRPPVRVSFPQAHLNAAAEAAAGSMIAYHYRRKTGRGQHVDVSMHESLIPNTATAPADWELNHRYMRRAGPYRTGLSSPVRLSWTWPCRDGHVAFSLFGGAAGAGTNRGLVEWMAGEGLGTDLLGRMDWAAWDIAAATQEQIDEIEGPIARFFMRHTKAELYEGALERRLMIMPVSDAGGVLSDPQLKARGFWVELEHAELGGKIAYPGVPMHLSEASCRVGRRAPLLGEHNREVYVGELGLAVDELVILKEGRVI